MSVEGPASDRVTTSVSVASTPAGIRAAHAWLEGLRRTCAASEAVWDAITLCLEESLMNVVNHGNREGHGLEIDLTFRKEGERFWIEIIDSGAAFNPLIAEPREAETLDAVVPGGQGIKLIRSFTTSCAYSRVGNRNHLSLGFTAGAR
ncbi:MAG: ATP-binding protein [Pseudomonadota bacterium]